MVGMVGVGHRRRDLIVGLLVVDMAGRLEVVGVGLPVAGMAGLLAADTVVAVDMTVAGTAAVTAIVEVTVAVTAIEEGSEIPATVETPTASEVAVASAAAVPNDALTSSAYHFRATSDACDWHINARHDMNFDNACYTMIAGVTH